MLPVRMADCSLKCCGQWLDVQIWQAKNMVSLPLRGGTYIGWMCEFVVEKARDKFLRVGVSPSRFFNASKQDHDKLMWWLPRCGLMAYIQFATGQLVPEDIPLVDLVPVNIDHDPQRKSMKQFRDRCRHDVLRVIDHWLAQPIPPALRISVPALKSSALLTRIYDDSDLESALRFWEKGGIVVMDDDLQHYVIDDTQDADVSARLAGYEWEEAIPVSSIERAQMETDKADLFICHASEDKDSFVRGLA